MKKTTTTMRTMMAMLLGMAILGASEASAEPLVFFTDSGSGYNNPGTPPWQAGPFNPYDESIWNPLPSGPQNGGGYVNCSDKPLDCLDPDNVVLDLTPLLEKGNNNLLFRVTGGGGRHFASLDTNFDEVNQVPEPASMILIGTGLIGIATHARKRRAAAKE